MSASGPVLLVEDNQTDVLLFQMAFKQARIENRLVTVPSGEEAIKYLHGEGIYADRKSHPEPVLLLLDLGLPGISGFEVLDWVRNQPGLRRLPIIVLTASAFAPDVTKAYDLGANSFLVKPHDFHEFTRTLRATAEFWLATCQLPASSPEPPKPPTSTSGPLSFLSAYICV